MNFQAGIIFVGIIFLVLGIIFHFQGNAVIGPQSSFMYSNPDWITYGIGIALAGIVIIGTGIGLKFLKNSNY